jgi:hypothetical protein
MRQQIDPPLGAPREKGRWMSDPRQKKATVPGGNLVDRDITDCI